jgi:hypothetical protein
VSRKLVAAKIQGCEFGQIAYDVCDIALDLEGTVA